MKMNSRDVINSNSKIKFLKSTIIQHVYLDSKFEYHDKIQRKICFILKYNTSSLISSMAELNTSNIMILVRFWDETIIFINLYFYLVLYKDIDINS